MAKTNAQRLDGADFIHEQFSVGSHLQALEDLANLNLLFVQFPKLLAQLDADDLTTSNYAATLTPTSPGNVRTQYAALLAKLDTDAKPAGSDYAATLAAATDAEVVAKWPALLTKLDGDDNGDNTYVAKNTLPFLTTINQEPSF